MLLPLSTVEKDSWGFVKQKEDSFGGELKNFLKEVGGLDFGEEVVRFGHRKPLLAFVSIFLIVFADLLVDPQQILMVTVETDLRTIGYEIERSSNDIKIENIYNKFKKLISEHYNTNFPLWLIDSNHPLCVNLMIFDAFICNFFWWVYSLEDGPVDTVWKNIEIPVSIVEANSNKKIITIGPVKP
ncbi:hypothetical protein LXL04_022525 [Taraxacum kok-saghyz]